MADSVEFNIEGLDSLLAKLATVTQDVRRKGGRSALRKAAKLIADKAKEGAARIDDPETGRSIAANIAIRWDGRRFKRTGDLGFRVGVQHGAVIKTKGNPDPGVNGPTPHFRLIEFGTANMAAQPFLRPALANNISQATSVFVAAYEKAIDAAIKRAAKKAAASP
jgi:HK97 gp10 family phage protein